MSSQDWAHLIRIVKETSKERSIETPSGWKTSREQNLKESKDAIMKMRKGRIANDIYGLPKIPENKHESAAKIPPT